MGTLQLKQWEACLKTIENLTTLSREEVDAAAATATAIVNVLTQLEPCPKATWKKLVLEMQVGAACSAVWPATAAVAVAAEVCKLLNIKRQNVLLPRGQRYCEHEPCFLRKSWPLQCIRQAPWLLVLSPFEPLTSYCTC
jgi:hypothetical protein